MQFFLEHRDAVIVSVLSTIFVVCFEMTLVWLSHFPGFAGMTP